MKRILLLGATGNLGQVLTDSLLKKQYHVVALVRNPDKLTTQHKNLTVIKGEVTNSDDIASALKNVDVVISTLGHGFRTSYPIQEKTLSVLIPLMEKQQITRFITITGSGLVVKGDPTSFISIVFTFLLTLMDPYRLKDARKQQVLLENSTLDWTVVRTPIHNSRVDQTISHVGFTQPNPWQTLSRHAISEFMISCIEESTWNKKSPIIF